MDIPSMFSHQRATANFLAQHSRVIDASDPGTGKTRSQLEGYMMRRAAGGAKRFLVVAPLSILEPSWGGDIRKFTRGLRFAIATAPAKNRRKAFESPAEIVLINTDGVVWIDQNPDVLEGFTDLCVDEFSAYKNRTTGRSKALARISRKFAHIAILSGTPVQNTLSDIWHPVYILDRGKRLGTAFSRFRLDVCHPVQRGPLPQHIKWENRPGAEGVVAAALSDITIRHVFEDCIDIPKNSTHVFEVSMPAKVMKAYNEMLKDSVLELAEGTVTAINAAVRAGKLLQIISGAVYDRDGNVVPVHNERAELVMQLVSERDHSLVAFTWQHEKEALLLEAKKRGLAVQVIDGKVPVNKRSEIVREFQDGAYDALLCHPASAAHGLTLTRGRATIWCSATPNSEHFKQFNRRIYRAGQTQKTETILISAKNTREEEIYRILDQKLAGVEDLLHLFTGMYKEGKNARRTT